MDVELKIGIGLVLLTFLFWCHLAWEQYARFLKLRRWAREKGLQPFKRKSALTALPKDLRLPDFRLIAGRKTPELRNVFYGDWNGHAAMFADFLYYFGADDAPRPVTIALIDMPGQGGGLVVRPETPGTRLTALVGAKDIDLESDEFNRHFHISAANKRWAYDALTPRNMDLLLKAADENYKLELWKGKALLLNEKQWEPAQIEKALDLLEAFVGNIPAFVFDEPTKGAALQK